MMNPEKAILGSILLTQGNALDQLTINADDFNDLKLGRVYQTLRDMKRQDEPIDPITVAAHLPRLPAIPCCRKSAGCLWHQRSCVAQGGNPAPATETNVDGADRWLSPHTGHADRCRHLLRQSVYHPRTRTAVPFSDLHAHVRSGLDVVPQPMDGRGLV